MKAGVLPGAGLDIVTFGSLSQYPELVYGVFGRRGGLSRPPFDSLNVGGTVGDDPAHVQGNLERICGALGCQAGDLVTVRQVHGRQVVAVTGADRGRRVGQFDALVTDQPGVPLILRFADCVPIILYDPRRRALGMAHAGWRGTVEDMAGAVVETMREEFGSQPADLIAGIGPSIGPCCYEVGAEVVQAARVSLGGETDLVMAKQGERVHLDLWAANRLGLVRAGVGKVETAGICTSCHRERFFSHRGDGGRTGRFALAALLRY